MNISQRLRTCAKHTGLDAVIELPQEAADEIDALQARSQVQGEAEVVQQAAARYLWLRDGLHKGDLRKTRRPSSAPYVVNPKKSVLYGIEAYRGQELDEAIDEDRISDLAQHIYEEAFVNGDPRFSDPEFKFSDEFANECLDKARAAMATTPQPAQATQAEVTEGVGDDNN